jgi:phosphoglycolate phosphatase/putative hydrolase of the HAD superfamily
MKIYKLGKNISAIIFDMDLTLYSHEEYGRMQIDGLIELLAGRQGKSFEQMSLEIEAYRKNWAQAHDGEKLSLSSVFLAYGITMEENIRWREEAYKPELYLKEDRELVKTLDALSASFALALVTNNAVSIARRTLSLLGVEPYFRVIVGLDTCMVPKPHRAPFLKAAELAGAKSENCVSIGDRYDVDLKIPLELGMSAILVDGVEDVYRLGEILVPCKR